MFSQGKVTSSLNAGGASAQLPAAGTAGEHFAGTGRLTLDVVTQDLAVALGTALAEALAALAASRHGC